MNPIFHVDEFENEIYFSDDYFNGAHYSFDFTIGSFFGGERVGPMRYVLESITPEYYKYLTSLRLQQDRADDPFAQPVQVFTNVEGGVGIFSGLAISDRSTK